MTFIILTCVSAMLGITTFIGGFWVKPKWFKLISFLVGGGFLAIAVYMIFILPEYVQLDYPIAILIIPFGVIVWQVVDRIRNNHKIENETIDEEFSNILNPSTGAIVLNLEPQTDEHESVVEETITLLPEEEIVSSLPVKDAQTASPVSVQDEPTVPPIKKETLNAADKQMKNEFNLPF